MKNVTVLTLVLLVYIICAAVSCEQKENDNCHVAIRLSNNSHKDVYVRAIQLDFLQSGSGELGYSRYRNTVTPVYKVKSGEQNNRRATDDNYCLEDTFIDHSFSDTLNLYVFDAFIVENTPWEVVARDYLVLKRYDLSLEDLQKLDWRVTYPPTEAMKDVEQYPPYGITCGHFYFPRGQNSEFN